MGRIRSLISPRNGGGRDTPHGFLRILLSSIGTRGFQILETSQTSSRIFQSDSIFGDCGRSRRSIYAVGSAFGHSVSDAGQYRLFIFYLRILFLFLRRLFTLRIRIGSFERP